MYKFYSYFLRNFLLIHFYCILQKHCSVSNWKLNKKLVICFFVSLKLVILRELERHCLRNYLVYYKEHRRVPNIVSAQLTLATVIFMLWMKNLREREVQPLPQHPRSMALSTGAATGPRHTCLSVLRNLPEGVVLIGTKGSCRKSCRTKSRSWRKMSVLACSLVVHGASRS